MDIAVDQELLNAAVRIGPVVRAHAERAEHERHLAAPVIEAMARAGLLRLYVPKTLGGLEADPVTVARIVEEVSADDSAAGWQVMVANSAAWYCARLPADGLEELYRGDPDAVLAAAFHPPMEATPTRGGFTIRGRSPLASGIHNARWLFVTARVTGPKRPPGAAADEVLGVILPTSEVEVADTWYALGMRGTDSNDVSVRGVWVPARRTYPMAPAFEPNAHCRSALYRAPAMAATLVPWTAVTLAIGRAAIDDLCALASGKTPFVSRTLLRERATTQAQVGRAEAALRAARLYLYDRLMEAWRRTRDGHASTLEQKAELLLVGVHAVNTAARVAERMYAAAGASAIYDRSPLERHFRDAQTLKQHGFLSENRYESAGQVFLGLEPDLGLVMF